MKIYAGKFATTAAAVVFAALAIGAKSAHAAEQTGTAGTLRTGLSQQQKWCKVAGSGPLSSSRRQYARKQCFGSVARFDKVKSWQGRATVEEVYTCPDHRGSEKRSATFTLQKTPAVTAKQAGILPQAPSKDPAVAALWKQMANGTIFARNPNTGVIDDWDHLSWYITGGKITNTWQETLTDMVPVDNVPHYAKRTITMHGGGIAPIQKEGRLVVNLKDRTWALHLGTTDGAGYNLTTVTRDPGGTTTTQTEKNSFQEVNLGTDGNTADWGPAYIKLPTAGLSISGHGEHKLDRCTTDRVSWQLTPVVNCGSYQALTLTQSMPENKEAVPATFYRWVFDTQQHPKGAGPYTVTGDLAYVDTSPNDIVDAPDDLEWTLPELPGVSRKIDPADAHGGTVSVAYNGMPKKNSQFAGHQVVATAPDLADCVQPETEPVKMFFARDGHGNPKGNKEPNWFYYWMQTKAEGGHPAGQIRYVKSGKKAMCKQGEFGFFLPLYNLSGYVTLCDMVAHADKNDKDLFGEIAYGIDQFGLTVAHEFIHKRLYDEGLKPFDAAWYHKLGPLYHEAKVYKTAVRNVDPDSDGLTNAEEKKYGLNPILKDTHCTGENDNEYLAYLISSRTWKLGSANKEDWACPGMQCGGQPSSPGGGDWPGCSRNHRHFQSGSHTTPFRHSQIITPAMQTLAMGEPLSGKQSGGIDESPLQQASKQVASSAISAHALTRIKTGLQSPDSSIRLQSVHKLVDVGGGPDLAAAAQEITEAFKLELALQTQSRAIPNGYLPSSAWRRIQYARLLADLPQKAHGVNFAAFKEAKGSLRSWLAISLGDAGDDRVTGVLVRLLHTNRDWPTRWAATEALGAIGSPQAVSALKQVMKNDPAHVKSGSDGTLASTFYPVREQAAGALIRLGQKIRLVAPNTYRVIKTPTGTASGAMDTGGAKQPIEQ